MSKFIELFKKYNKDFNKMFKTGVETLKCNSTKCKEEYEELEKYKKEVFDNILKLSEEENKTKPSKNHDKERIKIQKKFRENEDVKKYLENVKNGVKNEKKIADNYKKAYKTYQRELKSALKEYHKTETGKLYKKKVEKLFKELSYNIKSIALSKCSFEKCLKLHKKGLLQVKTITSKLCKEKNKKSCKISNAIAKLDVKKFNYKDNEKIAKMIKKGLT
jgi:hypothetical protein